MWISLAIGQHLFVSLNSSCEKGLSAGSILQRPLCLRFKYEYHLHKTFGKQSSVDCFYRFLELTVQSNTEWWNISAQQINDIFFFLICAVCHETVRNKYDRNDMVRTKTVLFHFFLFVLLHFCFSYAVDPHSGESHNNSISDTRLRVTEKNYFFPESIY